MKSQELPCTRFLQWALPHLRLRWRGYRKVKGQVCKRISARLKELNLDGFDDYKSFLEVNSDE